MQITEKSLPRMVKEFEEVVALSFCGTTSAPPEPLHQWFLEPNQEGSNPAAPLSEAPSKKRLLFFHSMGKFYRLQAMRHGGCFALQSSEGKIVAAASIFPPTEKKIYHPGMCEQLYIVNQWGMSSCLKNEKIREKIDLVDKLFTKGMQKHQSEGGCLYGRCHHMSKAKGMVQFLNESADYLGVQLFGDRLKANRSVFWEIRIQCKISLQSRLQWRRMSPRRARGSRDLHGTTRRRGESVGHCHYLNIVLINNYWCCVIVLV